LGFNQLGGTWKNTAGYAFTCNAGGQYVVFAYPNDNVTPVVQYYDANFNNWMAYSTSDIRVIDQAFVNQNGYSSNYRFVFVNVQYKSATVTIRLQ
jgi:DNA repair protein RadC